MQKNESIDIFLVFNALEAFGTEYAERNLRPKETITRTMSNHLGKNFLQIKIASQEFEFTYIACIALVWIAEDTHIHNNNNNNNNNNTDNLDKK